MPKRKGVTEITPRKARMIRSAWFDCGTNSSTLAAHYGVTTDVIMQVLSGELHPDETWIKLYNETVKTQKEYHKEKKTRKCSTQEELELSRRPFSNPSIEDTSQGEDVWRRDQGSQNW